LFKRFKRQEEIKEPVILLVKLMKVYVLANLLVTPIDALSIFLVYNPKVLGSDTAAAFILFMLGLASLVLFFSVILRGANALYRFHPIYRLLAIPIIVLWMELLGNALDFIYKHWMMVFFR
jgi:hypothetical protein